MTAWATRLSTCGRVVPFDYPYRREGRKAPDRQPVLIAAHQQALAEARAQVNPRTPIILAGKSMGSRIGCHVAALAPGTVAGVVCFGYPLIGQRGARRDEVLRALATPILFVQGSRDPMCPLDQLAEVRAAMTTRHELIVVEGGDHSLVVGARARAASGRTQEQEDQTVLAGVQRFFTSLSSSPLSFALPAGK